MRRQILTVFSAVTIVSFLFPAMAFAEDYTWTDNGNGTCTINFYNGPGGAVAIPDTLGSLTVTTIRDHAFDSYTSLTSVTIPDSVTTIGDGAFLSCSSMTSVTIGSSVTTIGDEAFRSCSNLTSVTIPDSVTILGDDAFHGCTSLTSVTIPDSVTSIGGEAFESCTSLTSVTIPDSVTTLGAEAFGYCSGLISVIIGNGVASIGSYTFEYCTSLTNLYFRGDAPSLAGSHHVFSGVSATAYYLSGTTGWEATYGGLPTALWEILVVDMEEFALLASYWQMTGCDETQPCSAADWYVDDMIDMLDLNQLAMSWLGEEMITDGPISSHVFEIEMSLSYDYGEGYSSSVPEDYQFDAWMWVDDTVVSGTVETPEGIVYQAEMQVEDGENWLGIYEWSTSLGDLSDFTDGDYIFTVTYANGQSQSTIIPFNAEDGSPLTVPPRPVVTHPVHGATDVSLNTTFLLDPSNMTNPVWTFGLEYFPISGTGLEGEFDNLPNTTTTVGPVDLSTNTEYEVELTANHAVWSTNNDGIPYVVDKDSEVEVHFTTVSAP